MNSFIFFNCARTSGGASVATAGAGDALVPSDGGDAPDVTVWSGSTGTGA
eukprot:CAMPEP_0175820978 /NCGR_PEP_ID=MMETSP0107_2-20121207/8891_1 /TAXON_ID=195067 ORGANISM="Goniomonas pacifica, Strain CCMP1869" /NCGR_SAMPLE_ID=MMETSP0107_2 /ASSEMBLY_ACC=CAM_ASM_000203 /LENGTH=49 /DNA_ID=CAMNT_0017133329 /DNA_START=743 /DNA_END=892 /DNA_ORIENTATION=-